jgi:hypothetical protein
MNLLSVVPAATTCAWTGAPATRVVTAIDNVGRVESPDYGVSTQGDFEPLVDEATF